MNTDPNAREQLWKMIKDIRFSMLVTRTADGQLQARPMTTQNRGIDEDDVLWFFASRRGDPVREISADPVVNLSYADPGSDCYVSVSGRADVVESAERKRALWSPVAKAWFPGGVDDPDLALLRVRITHAQYWDVHESKLVQLYAMVKAAITGRPPTDLGRTGEVSIGGTSSTAGVDPGPAAGAMADPRSQRAALDRSEQRAAEERPADYKKAAMEDKAVRIPSLDETHNPITGLDNP